MGGLHKNQKEMTERLRLVVNIQMVITILVVD